MKQLRRKSDHQRAVAKDILQNPFHHMDFLKWPIIGIFSAACGIILHKVFS